MQNGDLTLRESFNDLVFYIFFETADIQTLYIILCIIFFICNCGGIQHFHQTGKGLGFSIVRSGR